MSSSDLGHDLTKGAIVGTCVNIRTLRAARHKENGVPFRLLKPKKETPRWKPTTL